MCVAQTTYSMCFALLGTDVKKDMKLPTTFIVDGEGGRGVITKTAWSDYEFKPLLQSSDSSGCGIKQDRDPWKSCRKVVFWKCKQWMVITTIFLVFFLVIVISLILYSSVYTDEDDYWDPELLSSGNFHNFSGTLELMCGLPHFSSEDITKRLTEVYSSSPALGRYFRSAQVISFSNESSTVIYQLVFSVPPSTEGFMENSMNPDFIRNILRQNIYDEDTLNPGTSECDTLKLDPTSLT
ncbi:TPA-induced transmembrane protein isoform X3 [Chamaea fasciata]